MLNIHSLESYVSKSSSTLYLKSRPNPALNDSNMKRNNLESVAKFDKTDIELGRFIGLGNYCIVYDGRLSNQCLKKRITIIDDHPNLRNPFVVKKIKTICHRSKDINESYLDLRRETEILSSLSHKNIINIYGRCITAPDYSLRNSYFIVLEKLSCTLDQKLRIWSKPRFDIENKLPSFFYKKVKHKNQMKQRRNTPLEKRLKVAASIASGLSYLHSKNVLYRDLKPSNIGFDKNGEVKIFDLGLAVILKPDKILTEYCGSPRYMAPEVFQRQPYDYSVDVYSFGILLWQICSLQVPFEVVKSFDLLKKKVIQEDKIYRPKIDDKWKLYLQELMSCCWDANPDNRPQMSAVERILQQEVILKRRPRLTKQTSLITLPKFARQPLYRRNSI